MLLSIGLQFRISGRYMERVDNLVKRQDKLEQDWEATNKKIDKLNEKVESFLLGVGKMNAFTRQFFREDES